MSGRSNSSRRRAFTLLEMIIALMITAMLVMSLYRFVSVHLMALHTSTELGEEKAALEGVVRYLQAQMNTLPSTDDASLTGKAFKFRGLSADEITWTCDAGPGMLTTAAPGKFNVTLVVQPVEDRSTETELGLRRKPTPENTASLNLNRSGGSTRYDWLPLLHPMAAMEVRYFDVITNSWSDNWTDVARRPSLIRVRLWKHADDTPLEAMIRVPSAQIAK